MARTGLALARLAATSILLALAAAALALPVSVNALREPGGIEATVEENLLIMSNYFIDLWVDLESGDIVNLVVRSTEGEILIADGQVRGKILATGVEDLLEPGIAWDAEVETGLSVARARLTSEPVGGVTYEILIEMYSWSPLVRVKVEASNASEEVVILESKLGGPAILVGYAPAEGSVWKASYSYVLGESTAYETVGEVEGESKIPVPGLRGAIFVEEFRGEPRGFVGFTAPRNPYFIYIDTAFEFTEEATGALVAISTGVTALNPGESQTILEAEIVVGEYNAFNLMASNLLDEALTLYEDAEDLVETGFGFEKRIEDFQRRIDDLNSLVDDLREANSELEKRIEELEGRESYWQSLIDRMEEEISMLEARSFRASLLAPIGFIIGAIIGSVAVYIVMRRY